MRRRSSRSVRRLTNPRATNPSTSADMVGRVNPMWSHTSDSDAPSFLYTKANVRYCGTDISLAPYFRNSVRITRKTMGTPSRISCAHSPTVDRIVLACIFLCQSNCLKHELFTANGWFLFKKKATPLNQQLTSANAIAQTYQRVAAVFVIIAAALAAVSTYQMRSKEKMKNTSEIKATK